MIVLGMGSCLIALSIAAAVALLDLIATHRDNRTLRVF
ncbi:methylase of polypeptide subunit release factors [Rhizobium sp. BK196]|jgi:hypothetical protein|nr:hypothetical protein PMI11_04285 [Rhizobium sp. CF142]MBB3312989.1 methylase of polypeptide subunit release factors [Rhizobium sp. BK196]MBB3460579.1 methylase of polypeptide subunit release factors [Rhizobium sp. BK377]MDR6664402.1 methylase of polypeptide subunit release factors [Rhizobium sp. 1399]